MALRGHDLALLTARFGAARFGASRFGFIPCPEDVEGSGADEPGEYVWREQTPASELVETDWTLQQEDCVCRDLCTLALGAISFSDSTPLDDQEITASTALTGVLGRVGGLARIDWGDGRHDQQDFAELEDGTLIFSGHYHATGTYTVAITVTDERGCVATVTGSVTVSAGATCDSELAFDVEPVFTEGDCIGAEGVSWSAPTVSGGSGNYSYVWKIWNEASSEGSPMFTETTSSVTKDHETLMVDLFPTYGPYCAGEWKLTVSDAEQSCTPIVVTGSWTYCCI